MSLLAGARVALLEARFASEMADLVRREGGEPVCAPAVHEARVDVTDLIAPLIEKMRSNSETIVICLTGAGVASLFAQAEHIGRLPDLLDAMGSVTIVCRGPKPAAILRRYDVPMRLSVQPPHTTNELLDALTGVPMANRSVVIIGDGGRNSALTDVLWGRGADVQQIHTYAWQIPDDVAPIEQLVFSLIDDDIDAVAFTTQVQVRHLFEVAGRLDQAEALRHALRHDTVVASIGPTCSTVLMEFGVEPHVVASPPRMRPLVMAIAAHLIARGFPLSEATSI